MDQNASRNRRETGRKPVRTKVEFYVDADIVEAASVNVSETGLCFTTDEPILIRLRIDIGGKLMEREARLVWAGKNPEQGVDYGFEYTPDPEEYRTEAGGKS